MREGREQMFGRETVKAYFQTKEEAIALVKAFWSEAFDLSKHPEIAHSLPQLTDEEYESVVTIEAHRTSVRKAPPTEKDKGNFFVFFSRNDTREPMLAEADSWLKSKGY
jgi:hypothetical protein